MTDKPIYLQTESFFDHSRWSVHDRIGELLAQGVTQIALVKQDDAWTLSWPVRHPPVLIPETAA